MKGREMHAVWHLQDMLDLDEAEKQAINFRIEIVNGQPIQMWNNPNGTTRSFDLPEADVKRLAAGD